MQTTRIWRSDTVELAYLDCSGHTFPKHYHDDYVIGINTSGHEKIFIDGKTTEAGLDELTLYNPGEVQSSYAASTQWSFVSLHASPSLVQDSFAPDGDVSFTQSVFRCAPYAAALRNGALEALSDRVPENEVAEFVTLLLDGLFRHASNIREPRGSTDRHRVVDRAKQWLLDDHEEVALGEIAADVGVTPVQLVRMFKQELGLPPFRWRRVQRLLKAKRALQTRSSLADIAGEHGFADQSHFTREFRRMFAVTPAAYRRCVGAVS